MAPLLTNRRRRLLHCGMVVAALVGAGVSVGISAAERVLQLRIVSRKVEHATEPIQIVAGDRVELRWITDEATTIHLHGYDIRLALAPGTEARMRFDATATGRFPISAHGFSADAGKGLHREVVLIYVEVHPK